MPADESEGLKGNIFYQSLRSLGSIVDWPVTFFREKVVEPIQGKSESHYYHRDLRRIPTVDECKVEDLVCQYEADMQFKRDREVDTQIMNILRQRRIECEWYYGTDAYPNHCQKTKDDFETAATNWFSKYGDIGAAGNARNAYARQKHRMIWERRHGPIGSGTGSKGGELEA